MITYEDLNRLNDVQFEKLIKTLLLEVIGNGVTPFSRGKDGAREAIFTGKAEYPSKLDNWEGKWIFQVKYSDVTLGIDKARNQIKYSINNELKKLENYGYIAESKCDNYIYITNVPFSGESEKGLHDYIDKKHTNYKVNNFHYWDGEKIISLLNSHTSVRETFFPIKGVQILERKIQKKIKEYFVKPLLYSRLKEILIQKRVLNIVGQPHVGKSCLALFLGIQIAEENDLSNVFIVPLVDNLESIPQITNGVIIFDDLYGDINFESIGRKTKIINELSKSNYIIITSREYIYRDAERNRETIQILDNNLIINQEGAYSDNKLELILEKHLKINFSQIEENSKAEKFIISNKKYIITQLRYPHNIQLFTTIIDKYTYTKSALEQKIANAKKINVLILTWIDPMNETEKNILLALSLGRIYEVIDLLTICKTQWGYSKEIIINCLRTNERIVRYNDPLVSFIHPSYKSAIIDYFISKSKENITELVINLISHPFYNKKRLINRSLAYNLISDLDYDFLLELVSNANLTKNYIEVIWFNLIMRNKEEAVSKLLLIKKYDEKKYLQQFKCFVAAKDYMKDKDIINLLEYLLTKRKVSKVIESLIIHFSFKIRNKVRSIIEQLDIINDSRDLKLKIRLLGVIGSLHPESVVDELEAELKSKYVSTRNIVYSGFNMFASNYNVRIIEILERAYIQENNNKNKLKIEKSIRNRKKLMK